METKCAVCGSAEVVTGLWVFTSPDSTRNTPYVTLKPPKGGSADFRFQANVCSGCGHAALTVADVAAFAAVVQAGGVSPK